MFVLGPVEAAKPNLKVDGTAPFVVAKFGISISVSPGPKAAVVVQVEGNGETVRCC